jgi:pyrophosphatase PpaX
MKIRGILFDIDGTLANTLPICIKAYQHSFEHFTGRAYSEQEVTAHFGITEAGIFQRIMPEQWEEGLKYYFDTYEKLHVECRAPFPGVDEALKLLQERGILTAVVTGKGDYSAAYTLKYLGIAQYFDRVEAGDDHAVVKSAAIGKVLAAWQMEPGEAAYLGDTDSDMQQAMAAGVLPLGADWAETSTLHLLDSQTPVTTFLTLQSFIKWLDEHIEANAASSSAKS